MYRSVRILTQSKSNCLLRPGRIVDVYFDYYGVASGPIIYYGFGETCTFMKPDFDFEFFD